MQYNSYAYSCCHNICFIVRYAYKTNCNTSASFFFKLGLRKLDENIDIMVYFLKMYLLVTKKAQNVGYALCDNIGDDLLVDKLRLVWILFVINVFVFKLLFCHMMSIEFNYKNIWNKYSWWKMNDTVVICLFVLSAMLFCSQGDRGGLGPEGEQVSDFTLFCHLVHLSC